MASSMASPTPEYTNPQAPPLRLPKLSYRTKSCDSESVSSASTAFTRAYVSTTPTSPLNSTFCPSPRTPPSDMSLPSSPRQSSFTSSPKPSANLTKTRSKFLAGLFGVKEPSAQALQDYERQLMKQGRGRVTPIGMPGVSSAKLPAAVPKVNSKWDGVPQALKEKEKQNDAARQLTSGLSRHLGTSRSGGSESSATSTADSSKRRLSRGTLGGGPMRGGSSNNLAELYGWETSSSHSGGSTINFAAEHRPTTLRSAPSLQQTSSSPSREPLPPPVISSPPMEPSPSSRSASPSPPSLCYSPMLTPYDSSPATPDAPLPFISLASLKIETTPEENVNIASLETPGLAEEVIVKSAGVNILGPPAAAKRKPKPTPLQSSEQRPKISRTGFQTSAIIRSEVPVPRETPSPRPPLGSYFPDIMSTSSSDSSAKVPARRNSTREKLAVGLNSKNQISAPRPSPEEGTNVSAKGERIITPTPEGGKSSTRKSRMTLFKR